MQLAETLAIHPIKPQGKVVPPRVTIVEHQEDWRLQHDNQSLWSVGLLREQIAWTDAATCLNTDWEGLIITAPDTEFDAIRDNSYSQAWNELVASLPTVSVQVVINNPWIDQYDRDFFASPDPDMLMIVHLYTKEYFDQYEEHVGKEHPSLISPWLDIFRHIIHGLSAMDWSDDNQLTLAERLAAGQIKAHQLGDREPQEVYLLNRRPGRLTAQVQAYALPRMG